MHPQFFIKQPVAAWGLLSVLLLATGCSPSRIMGDRIVAAPNRAGAVTRRGAIDAAWERFMPAGSTNPCRFLSIPVGPPTATLTAIAVPPRNYNFEFVSKIDASTNGRGRLSLALAPRTHDTFIPLQRPATVILLHGYRMYKETMAPWALLLAQAGYRVVLMDLRGHGESTGREISFGKLETRDLTQALDYLQKAGLCDGNVGVLGFSYGATMALHWAAQDSRVRTVIAIAPYNQPDEAILRCAKALKISVPNRTAKRALARASDRLSLKWSDWSGEKAVRDIEQPILLIGAGRDSICPPADIALLEKFAPEGSRSILVPEANHHLLGIWLHELGEPVKNWFDEQLQSRLRVAAGE